MHPVLQYSKTYNIGMFFMLLASSDASQSSGGSGMCSRNDESAFTWLKHNRSLVNIGKAEIIIKFCPMEHIPFISELNKNEAF